SGSNVYKLEDKEVLQLSVPIILNEFGTDKIIGAVLISFDMTAINNNVNELRNDMIKVGALGLFFSLLLTVVATHNLTKPLRALTIGVEKISEGQLGYIIQKKSKDELGRLIDTFNRMSSTLSKIEKNRKNYINSISHELKTPLTSIKVLIESLSIGNNDVDTYKEYLQDIYGEAERMERLVNYLMESIKLEESIFNLKEENISQILKDTIKLIRPYADKSNVHIKFTGAENIIVKCDGDKVKEMIFNLLDNSIKYRDPCKENSFVHLTLNKENNRAILKIEDNGIGIDEKNIKNIFNRGFRVLEGELNGSVEGYGIGLTIVKNIIDKHGWDISVESTLKKGSIFKIQIPL
ncbi:MAG: HAMP domain-containing histidine kinase, partial [Tissierellia bacterium]|nr:HAMP domain-containing histidine kinase [Tissierellia bacterium]